MGNNRRAREFWESAGKNSATFIQYYNRLTELSISMFDWQNVPDTVDIRFLELTLFGNGQAVFFKDEVLGYLCLPCATSGQWNVYNIPTKRRAYASNSYNRELDDTDSVIIFNNMLHTPSRLDVQMFSRRLEELDRIIDVNVRAQKTPVLIKCGENERLSMKQLYEQYDGNQPFIFGQSELRANALQVLKTDAPYIADNIYQLKSQYWNEALTYLGISNTNVNKKERLISDEVTRNMGGVIASRYSRLESRRTAADQINKMFGLDISVDYREDYREIDQYGTMYEDDTQGGNVIQLTQSGVE